MSRLKSCGGIVVLLAAAMAAGVPAAALGQGKKGPPEHVIRKVSIGTDEATAAATIKEYLDEGWELTEKGADGLAVFRRRFVPADKLGHERVLADLQGTWTMVRDESNGMKVDVTQRIAFHVEGHRFTSKVDDKVTQVGTIQYLRRVGDLILVDFLIQGGDDQRDRWDTARVMVRIDGRTMRYVSGGIAAVRPKGFETQPGDGYQSSVFTKAR